MYGDKNESIEKVYNRYLYIKNRYLSLIDMTGGGNKPHIFSLKDINLFIDKKTRSYLDPTYGFIYASLQYIKNVYILKDDILPIDGRVIKLIKNSFRLISDQIQPVKELKKNLKSIDIGRFLAHKYIINNTHRDTISEFTKKVKIITDHISSAKADKRKRVYKKTVNYSKYIVEGIEMDVAEGDTIDSFITTLVNYKNRLEIELKRYMNVNYGEYINNFIAKVWREGNDILMYHIVLAILWHNADSKAGIEEYYIGINEVFERVGLSTIDIPANFSTSLFTHELTLDNNIHDNRDNFNYMLAVIYYTSNKIHISTQDYTNIYIPEHISFRDCGEVALRNFIQILITRVSGFDFSLLDKYGAIDQVKEYFKYFNTNLKVSDDYTETGFLKDRFEHINVRLKSRDAWGMIVSNLECARYYNKYMADGDIFNYEILDGTANDSDIPNMLAIIRYLFREIKEWEDFNDDIVDVKNNLDINKDRISGDVHIYNKFLGKYTMGFHRMHYTFVCDTYEYIDITHEFERDEMFYLELLNKSSIENRDFLKYISKDRPDDWIYYLIENNNDIVDIINTLWNFISIETYKKLLDYVYTKFDADKFSRTEIYIPYLTDQTFYEYTGIYYADILESLHKTSVTELVLNIRIEDGIEVSDISLDFTYPDIDRLTSLTINPPHSININNINNLNNLVDLVISFNVLDNFWNTTHITTDQLKDFNRLKYLCVNILVLEGDTTILERLDTLEVNKIDYQGTDMIKILQEIFPKIRLTTLHIDADVIFDANIILPTVEVFSTDSSVRRTDRLFKLLPNVKVIAGGDFIDTLTIDMPELIEISNIKDIRPFMKYLPQIEILMAHSLNIEYSGGDYFRDMIKLKKLSINGIDIRDLHKLENSPLVDIQIFRLRSPKPEIPNYKLNDYPLIFPTLETLYIKSSNTYEFLNTETEPILYIGNMPNITNITIDGYMVEYIDQDESRRATRVNTINVPRISIFAESNTNINNVYFQKSDISNIDSVLSNLPNITLVSFPEGYHSDNFTTLTSPFDNCPKLQVIIFNNDINDDMANLGIHLEKLQDVREIYFNEFVTDAVFNNLSTRIKKLVM